MLASPEVCRRRRRQTRSIGLAFSGGGIRSATFNLGILQGLARSGLLHQFDYLSTVSGGGYIGSWLAAVTKRYLASVPGSSFRDVEQALVPENYQPGERHERSFLRWLRLYSNYLTPRSGATSGDTWAMIGTWSRNCFLNQTILGLLFLGFFVLCDLMLLALVRSWGLGWDMVGCGCAVLFLAAVAMGFNVVDQTTREDISKSWFQRVKVTLTVMVPFLAASLLLNAGLWRLAVSDQYALRSGGMVPAIFQQSFLRWAAGGAAFYFVAWALVALFVALRRWFAGEEERRNGRHLRIAVFGGGGGCDQRQPAARIRRPLNPSAEWRRDAMGRDCVGSGRGGAAALELRRLSSGDYRQRL